MGIFAWVKFMVQVLAIAIWRNFKSVFTLSTFSRGARVYKMSCRFDESEASIIHKPGTSTIEGQAYIQLIDGARWTARGHYFNQLIPTTQYAQERMMAIFENDQAGFVTLGSDKWRLRFGDDETKFKEYIKEASVDREGYFEFKNISAGTYYVLSFVRQGVNDSIVGGDLMQKVTVAERETKNILMVENFKQS